MSSSKMLNCGELAEILGVTRHSLEQNWKQWNLPGIKITGKLLRFRQGDIDAWLDKRKADTDGQRA